MFHKLNNLEDSISRLTNQQHVHSEEENPEEVYLSDTMVEEHCTLLTEESNGKEAVEEPIKHVLKPFPTKLNPTSNAQANYNPLPVALYPEPLHILLIPATQFTPERTGKTEASPFALPVHNFRKLVATVQTFATTSKTSAATYTAWHSGWLKKLITSSISFSSTTKQGLRNWFEWTQGVHSPFYFYFYFYYVLLFILFYFIFLYLIFLFRFSLIFKLIFVLACFSLFCNFS